MNIQNLTQQEVEQLQMLLNKLNPPRFTERVYLDPVNKMIDDIIDNFDFKRVHSVMEHLNWQWAGKDIPSIDNLKDTARYLLKGATFARLHEYKHEHWEQGIHHGSGGFEATAFCNESKSKIDALHLKFVLADWDEEIED